MQDESKEFNLGSFPTAQILANVKKHLEAWPNYCFN